MILREWLLCFDCGYLNCEIWVDGEDELAYKGTICDIPWTLTEMKFNNDLYGVSYYYDNSKDWDNEIFIFNLK